MDRDPTGQLRRSWDANAEAWVAAIRTGSIESRRLVTDDAILHATLSCAPRSVLDLGCGEGWLTRALAERGVESVGADASVPLVEAARRNGGGRFEVCSYEELRENPTRLSGPFDVVVCNFSLLEEHLGGILASVRQRLHADGRLLIQTVHPWIASGGADYHDGWRVEHFHGVGVDFTEPMPWYFRTLESWSEVFSEAGYVVTRILEPRHPETEQPLSLLIVARPLA